MNILLLDDRDWHDCLLPAGNLREPLAAARRATVIAIPAGEPKLDETLRKWGWRGPVWHLRRTMDVPAVAGPVAAFCGIARPEQFFAGLEEAGIGLCACIAFSDHHPYKVADLQRLVAKAHSSGATALITTEKDQVRLGSLAEQLPTELPLLTAGLQIAIVEEDSAMEWLVRKVQAEAQLGAGASCPSL